MTTRIRALMIAGVVLATIWIAGCDHYVCTSGATFGNSSCTSTGTTPGSASALAFAVDQTNGTIDGYTLSGSAVAATSSYTAPAFTTGTPSEGMVVAQGKYVYVVAQVTQQIFGYSISSSGGLSALSGFPMTVTGMGGIADESYNQQVVITNPAGTLLFISEFANETILVYQIGTSGQLTLASAFSTLPLLEPQNMAMDGQGRFLYVAESSSDHEDTFIMGYAVSSTGQLTEISGSPFSMQPCCWEMAGDGTGKYLVGISGKTASLYGTDDDSIYVYSIDQTSGALSTVSGSPFLTQYAPFNIVLQPIPVTGTSQLVYSFSVNDEATGTNPIEGFQLNTSTGQISELSDSPFTSLSVETAWGQFDPSGDFLFYYTGTAPTVGLGAMSVGSDGSLTALGAAVALTTPGYWAVSDVP